MGNEVALLHAREPAFSVAELQEGFASLSRQAHFRAIKLLCLCALRTATLGSAPWCSATTVQSFTFAISFEEEMSCRHEMIAAREIAGEQGRDRARPPLRGIP
jgi:hypothetical protein